MKKSIIKFVIQVIIMIILLILFLDLYKSHSLILDQQQSVQLFHKFMELHEHYINAHIQWAKEEIIFLKYVQEMAITLENNVLKYALLQIFVLAFHVYWFLVIIFGKIIVFLYWLITP